MKTIEVCLTPDLLQHVYFEDKIVVVIDIFRATSCIVTALYHGASSIIPVMEIEECMAYQQRGYLGAAERNGFKVDGFDFGNSPLSYVNNPLIKDRTIAMTTSNGTVAIAKVSTATQVVIGSFLNKTAIIKYLLDQQKDALLLCAGWKGQVNLEDSIFAGAVLDDLVRDFKYNNDACGLARSAYHLSKNNPKRFLTDSAHFHRLKDQGRMDDIDFCLTTDIYEIVPILEKGEIIRLAV
ncbi:MAG: 2-phosphosulfolactate phosphatase [Microscillaceae bacterium]|nr:2-phosphosulfolactate phosphatase [Microscillaceae bacterium]